MFRRSTPQEENLKQINAQILGIKMNLDISEQNVSHGIQGINVLRSQKDLLLENFRVLKEQIKVISIESLYQIKTDLKTVEENIKKALAIYSRVRIERDGFKNHYDKALKYRSDFIKENLSDTKILVFKRKKNDQKSNARGDSKKTRK